MNHHLTQDQRNQLEALAEEYAGRKRHGDEVAIEEYVQRYPELASDIRELFPVVAMLDKAGGKSERLDHQESAEQVEAGTRLGEYQLLRLIGRGGMGVVYQAEHIALGSIAAIKVLPASRSGPKGRERFQREASAAARMHHPNIVRVFDFGCQGDSLYYVMPLVEGWGLDRLIGNHAANTGENSNDRANRNSKRPTKLELAETLSRSDSELLEPDQESDDDIEQETGPLAKDVTRRSSASGSRPDDLWNWVAKLGIQAADALDYAHSAGIVHRDVKPSNLMIDADNHVYVTDFGLAKIVDEHSLTGTGDLLGTLRYMPPEAFAGRADQRSDIYGLGLTLYELLADRPAFTESERGPLMTAITDGRVARLQTLVPGVPRDLQTVIHKAIDVDPATRYQTASDFRDDLQRLASGEPIQARRSTWAYRTSRWISRNRAVAALTALTILTLVVGLIVSSVGWSRALSAEANATELVSKENRARKFAEAETAAKVKALEEKQVALALEKRERDYAEAVAQFVTDDVLALTSVEGQLEYDDFESIELGPETKLSTLLIRAGEKLDQREDIAPYIKMRLREIIGINLREVGEFENSIHHLQEAIELSLEVSGKLDGDTLSLNNSLITSLARSGRIKDAIQLSRELLDGYGWDVKRDPSLIYILMNLARAEGSAENYNEALRLAQQAHQYLVDCHGENHPDSLFAITIIAAAHSGLGDFRKASELLEPAVKQMRVVCGPEDTRLHAMSSSMGVLYFRQRRFGDAVQVFEELVQQRKSLLGLEHRNTARSMANLAVNLRELKRYNEAIPLLESALEIRKKVLGEFHPDTLVSINQLAAALYMVGQSERSLELLNPAIEFARERFGETGTTTLRLRRFGCKFPPAFESFRRINLFASGAFRIGLPKTWGSAFHHGWLHSIVGLLP